MKYLHAKNDLNNERYHLQLCADALFAIRIIHCHEEAVSNPVHFFGIS